MTTDGREELRRALGLTDEEVDALDAIGRRRPMLDVPVAHYRHDRCGTISTAGEYLEFVRDDAGPGPRPLRAVMRCPACGERAADDDVSRVGEGSSARPV